MKFQPKGIVPALVTPMTAEGHLDEKALEKLIEYVIGGGVHGVFIVSSTGESYALSPEEKKYAMQAVVAQAKGRIAVYAGSGGFTTRESIELTQMAESCGVDAVSVMTPMFITPSQDQLYEHYRTVAGETKLPMLLYNNVQRTNVNISAELVDRLADIPNIVGVKDSSGDMTLSAEYIRVVQGREFGVLMGRDTLIFGGLCYGAAGSIAACANVAPRLCVDIYDKYMAGDIEGARQAQFSLSPLRLAFSLGTFPAVIKDALNIIGLPAGECLPPVTPLNDAERARLKVILNGMGLA